MINLLMHLSLGHSGERPNPVSPTRFFWMPDQVRHDDIATVIIMSGPKHL
jgi:hypothetical protein